MAAHFPELDEAIRKWLSDRGTPLTVGNVRKFLPPESTALYVPNPTGLPTSPHTTMRFPLKGVNELSGSGFRGLLRLLRRPKSAQAENYNSQTVTARANSRLLNGIFEPADFEKAAVLAAFGPAVKQLTAHPAVRQWFGQHGLYMPLSGSSSGNPVFDQEEFQQRGEHWDAMAQAATADKSTYQSLLRGIANLTGMSSNQPRRWFGNNMATTSGKLDSSLERVIDRAAGDITRISPYMMTFAPELWDRLHGDKGTAAALASSVYKANRGTNDPVTGRMGYSPETSAHIAQGVFEHLYGPSSDKPLAMGNSGLPKINTHGYSARDMGLLYEQMRGLGLVGGAAPDAQPGNTAPKLSTGAGAMTGLQRMTGLLSKFGAALPAPGLFGAEGEAEHSKLMMWHLLDDLIAFHTSRLARQAGGQESPSNPLQSPQLIQKLDMGMPKQGGAAVRVGYRFQGETKIPVCPRCHRDLTGTNLYCDTKNWLFCRACFRRGGGRVLMPGQAEDTPEPVSKQACDTASDDHVEMNKESVDLRAVLSRLIQRIDPKQIYRATGSVVGNIAGDTAGAVIGDTLLPGVGAAIGGFGGSILGHRTGRSLFGKLVNQPASIAAPAFQARGIRPSLLRGLYSTLGGLGGGALGGVFGPIESTVGIGLGSHVGHVVGDWVSNQVFRPRNWPIKHAETAKVAFDTASDGQAQHTLPYNELQPQSFPLVDQGSENDILKACLEPPDPAAFQLPPELPESRSPMPWDW